MTKIFQLEVGPMANYAYLICDEASFECAVVDPGWNAEAIAAEAKKNGFKVTKILLTHTHFDHANSTVDLAKATGAAIYVHSSEAEELPVGYPVVKTAEGSVIDLGKTKIECIHTPGHTPGSQCFIVGNAIFTGDTLFVDGCGRVDLPGGEPGKMLESLHRLAGLDRALTVYPGHNYGSSKTSTIGEQLASNPCLSAKKESFLL